MSDKILPMQHHLEVYEESFDSHTVSYHLGSSTPFFISVGDHFNHRLHDGWLNPPNTETEKFVVSEIEHIFWTIENSHHGHKLMVLLKKEPYKG